MRPLLRIRAAVLVFLTHRLALPVLVLVRRPKPFPYTATDLARLAPGTTGAALAAFLEAHGLQLLRHYEKHDLKHLLFGYPPTDAGEVCLQTFMLGTGHKSFPVLISVIFGILFMPDAHRAMRAAWRRGRQTPSMESTDWAALIPQPLAAVQARLLPAG